MPPKYVPKPHDIVIDFLQDKNNMKDLLYVEDMDTFYVWKGGWYEFIPDKKLAKMIFQYCLKEHNTLRITQAFIKDLIALLRWQVVNEVTELSNKYICFKDCLLDTETWETCDHDRDKVSVFYLPYNYADLPDEHPNWDKFLATSLVQKETLEEDKELLSVVQEMFGDFFLPHVKSATSYFLVGHGANGKSVMLDVATEIIGQDFISAMNIETLTTKPFYLPHIIGKRVNISNEEESKFIKADKFKSLVTGDAQTCDRKYGDPFTFKPNTKFVFASNRIPTFNDLNFGIIRRIKIIPFNQRFDENNPLTDIHIADKLREELPAIVKWAIQGAQRLGKRNYQFSKSDQALSAMEDFQGDISSAILFFRENFKVDNNNFISNKDLYNEYKMWCEEVGKKAMSKHNFGKDLHATFNDLKTKSGRDLEGNTTNGKNISRKTLDDPDDLPETAIEDINFGEEDLPIPSKQDNLI